MAVENVPFRHRSSLGWRFHMLLLLLLHLHLHLHFRGVSSFVMFPHDNYFRVLPVVLRSSSSSSPLTMMLFQSSSNEDVPAQQQQEQQEQQEQHQERAPPLQPVIIIDDDNATGRTAAKAAILALQTWQVLKGQLQIPSNDHHHHGSSAAQKSSSSPCQPPVFVVGSKSAELRRVNNKPVILHIPIDTTTTNAAATAMTILEMLQQPPSFIGLHLYDGNNIDDDLDSAQSAGTALQGMLRDCCPNTACCVSLDLKLHLALLRINALPKDAVHSNHHGDSYHVLMPEGGSLLIDYQYDHGNPFGGADPLKCPTKAVLIETPPTSPSLQRSRHLAAAYTAVRGQQQNQNNQVSTTVLSAAIIAASVATILGDDDNNGGSSAAAASMTTWNMIQRTVQLSSHIRNFGIKEQVPGFMRQKYKEYGHK